MEINEMKELLQGKWHCASENFYIEIEGDEVKYRFDNSIGEKTNLAILKWIQPFSKFELVADILELKQKYINTVDSITFRLDDINGIPIYFMRKQ
jgi:hypothetical protein